MSRYGQAFDLALGALWSGGYFPPLREVMDLEHKLPIAPLSAPSFSQHRLNEAQRAMDVLSGMGYLIEGDPKNFKVMIPTVDPRVQTAQDDERPRAGHLICLTGNWNVLKPGDMMRLQGGAASLPRRGLSIANAKGSWHMNINARLGVSLSSGGPSSIGEIDCEVLKPTSATGKVWHWSWAISPQANGGVDWSMEVPIWEWDGSDDDYIDWQLAETTY